MCRNEIRMVRRGVRREEYLSYFQALGGVETEPGHFTFPDWDVTVSEERQAALFAHFISEVDIVFRGPERMLPDIVAAFRLRFLRAGG